MVIQSSDVAMSSGRTYERQTRDRSSVRSWGEVLSATTSPTARDSKTIAQRVTRKPMSLREFFSLLLRKRQEDFERFLENYRIGMRGGGTVRAGTVSVSWDGMRIRSVSEGGGQLAWEGHVLEHVSRETEKEKTAFAANGQVKTADGKTIDLGVWLQMGRSYTKETRVTELSVKQVASGGMATQPDARFTDPLVINFAAASAGFTEETFSFDIDADGELDNIALLGQGCGYLALDRNGDGRIGDGSELFGTKSGDGFADLKVFDVDGNGWIDEKDPIFDRLRIWTRDSGGNDKLVGLGVSGIGAIYLGSVPTEFSLKDKINSTIGVIRSSGIFLREDGSAGTVQQVDVAKNDMPGRQSLHSGRMRGGVSTDRKKYGMTG